MKQTSLQRSAENLGIKALQLPLQRGANGKMWVSPKDGTSRRVEDAVLDHYVLQGWRGSSAEGGLILNLIKAMSFTKIPNHHRGTFVEAIYHQNVQPQFKLAVSGLLGQVARADSACIEQNVAFLTSRHPVVEDWGGGITFTNSTCMLDFFPTLEPWMFTSVFQAAGNNLMHRIATKFAEDPYEFRRGWPDLTLWRDSDVRFVEVKAPGDKVQASQKKVIEEFAKPLDLDFTLVEVIDA